jgi:hypothetical protein
MRVPSEAQLKVIQDEDAIAQNVCRQLSAFRWLRLQHQSAKQSGDDSRLL